MAELAFEGVRKRYGEVEALRGLDLTIRDGELLVIVGPSGCGKTTALRVASGLERPDGGAVRIGGRDVTAVEPSKRNISMVFQGYALFPHLTVAENIGFGLRARRVPRDATRSRVAAAAEVVGCEALLARRPWELSGGERQRVALARALVREPDVFLLDEPLSNLDAHLRVRMRIELRRLHNRLGATMVHVTHDQVEALTLGDRVAVMRDGVLQQVGDPDEVYRRPANRFVATFVGSPSMNVIPAVADGDRLVAGPFGRPRPAGSHVGADAGAGSGGGAGGGGSFELGVRPEDIEVDLAAGAGSGEVDGSGRATVLVVEPAGAETYLVLDADGIEVVARVGPDVRPVPGSIVGITARADRLHVFDAATGATVR